MEGNSISTGMGKGSAFLLNDEYSPVQQTKEVLNNIRSQQERKRSKPLSSYGNLYNEDVDGWDIDTKRELSSLQNQYFEKAERYLNEGLDPTDPSNIDAFTDLKKFEKTMKNASNASRSQRDVYNKLLKEYSENQNKYTPESAKNLERYRRASINDRVSLNSANILVPKQKTGLEFAQELAKGLKTDKKFLSPYIDEQTKTKVFPSVSEVDPNRLDKIVFEVYKNNPNLSQEFPGEEGYEKFKGLVSSFLPKQESKSFRNISEEDSYSVVKYLSGGKAEGKNYSFGYQDSSQDVMSPTEFDKPYHFENIPVSPKKGLNENIRVIKDDKEFDFRPSSIVGRDGKYYLKGFVIKPIAGSKTRTEEVLEEVPYEEVKDQFEFKYDNFNLDDFLQTGEIYNVEGTYYSRKELEEAGWSDVQIKKINTKSND